MLRKHCLRTSLKTSRYRCGVLHACCHRPQSLAFVGSACIATRQTKGSPLASHCICWLKMDLGGFYCEHNLNTAVWHPQQQNGLQQRERLHKHWLAERRQCEMLVRVWVRRVWTRLAFEPQHLLLSMGLCYPVVQTPFWRAEEVSSEVEPRPGTCQFF